MHATVQEGLYIGLMSGTSLNSIDCGLFDINNNAIRQKACLEAPLPNHLRTTLLDLCEARNDSVHKLATADRDLAQVFSKAVIDLLARENLKAKDIVAIGCHGQTIRHKPCAKESASYSLQIGDPNTIACLTGITTVADFRRRDIALGGQGAPLAPAFHRFAFFSPKVERCVINLGGMANLTRLTGEGDVIGFDTGPGNVLMDAWIAMHKPPNTFDKGGLWAAGGTPIEMLLERLMSEPWLSLPPPKSTGRELFSLGWLEKKLLQSKLDPQDVMATLLQFTTQTIADHHKRFCTENSEIYICGGGAHNSFMLKQLSSHLNKPVYTTETLNIHPDWVEAATFAWLAKQTLKGKKLDWSTITGANPPSIYGVIFPSGE